MSQLEVREIKTDVVVVGGGGAALRAALSAGLAGATVHLLAKAPVAAGGSTVHGASEIMGIGAAAGLGDENDSPQAHFHDTMALAQGFIDPALVRVLADDAPSRIRDLIDLGVPFDRDGQKLRLITSDFASYARVLTAKGRTGRAIVAALATALKPAGVEIHAPVVLIDLIRDDSGAISGALAYDTTDRVLIHYRAPAIVLGSGGMHGAFSQQVSTQEMTGDGQAICYRHGAELVNLEFHQFGPAMIHPYVQLLSKSIYMLEPRITNHRGDEFLATSLPPGVSINEVLHEKVFPFTTTNASRFLDIAIAREVNEGRGTDRGGIYFSFSHVPEKRLRAMAPNTANWIAENGLDMQRDQLEVGLAFQCMNGGVRMVDSNAQSTIPGLFVVGEIAGGVRGPDRPGGNSLAEGQVFGHRAGVAAAAVAHERGPAGRPETLSDSLGFLNTALNRRNGFDYNEAAYQIREQMQRHCLVEKNDSGLTSALRTVTDVLAHSEDALSATPENLVHRLGIRNLAQASELVLHACLHRAETRGSHYRPDFPETDSQRFGHSFAMSRKEGRLSMAPLPYAQA